jgi:hypothetical protein
MERVLYSSVKLTEQSRTELIQKLQHIIPNNWEIIADHMTINLGPIKKEFEEFLGKEIRLTVVKLGISDKVIAVEVKGMSTINQIPHITVAVNREEGGKPVMSNRIIDWEEIEQFDIYGVVEEEIMRY